MDSTPPSAPTGLLRQLRLSHGVFDRIEQGAYVLVGALLAVTTALALAGAGGALWMGLMQGGGTSVIADIIERLLFVLMLVEILHTVRASIRSGGLSPEPFLIVGLIACIRRILVSTLESAEANRATADPAAHEAAFRIAMVELGVLGFLILVMVVSIYLLRRVRTPAETA